MAFPNKFLLFFDLDVVIVCRVDSIVTDIEFTIEWLQLWHSMIYIVKRKKGSKMYFFYWQCSLILGVATLVIFILLGCGPVDYYVTARPLITKSCVVENCRKKGTQCFRLGCHSGPENFKKSRQKTHEIK